jgi:hypothetical protein
MIGDTRCEHWSSVVIHEVQGPGAEMVGGAGVDLREGKAGRPLEKMAGQRSRRVRSHGDTHRDPGRPNRVVDSPFLLSDRLPPPINRPALSSERACDHCWG